MLIHAQDRKRDETRGDVRVLGIQQPAAHGESLFQIDIRFRVLAAHGQPGAYAV